MTTELELNTAYEKILAANLQRAIDFQKFAEAKNAALMAISSAWVMACINVLAQRKTLPEGFGRSISIALLCSICAGFLALWSFLPRLELTKFLGGAAAGPHPRNFLYFGDINSFTAREFEIKILERYCSQAADYISLDYIHDLVVQIWVNSKITKRKMRFFTCGVFFIIVAAAVFLVPSVLLIFEEYKIS